jgi:organic radical activating enzyme
VGKNMMKAPGDTRPTWRDGILQIHITRACDLSCISCTQGSNLAGKPVMMTPEQFEVACESLKDYYGVIGIFGGNPTLHPNFRSICEIFKRIIPYEQRGLWSNNLREHGKLCRETFNPNVSNLNVHASKVVYDKMKSDWPECHPIGTEDSRHSPPYVAMKDMVDMTYEEQWNLIQNCDINQLWSAMVCSFRGELRGFFCELAGAQSMLHQDEPDYPDTGLPITSGWWKLPIGAFDHQIKKHCFECGIPLRGMGDLAVGGETEYVSETHKNIYQLKRPNGKELRVVSNRSELGGSVTRATDYIANGALSNMKILIGVPTSEMARRADFYDYFNMLNKPDGTMMTFAHGQSPARNRNLIIDQALENDCTHILFIDDDTAFKPNMLSQLLAHDKDIVTGLYLMRNYPHQPIIFDYADEEGRCTHHWLHDGKKGLVEIVASGLGACLIKTDVFRALDKPYVRLGELEKDHWCDDIGFFRRVREAGFKLYCDLDCLVGHMASVTVWPNPIDGKWMTSYESNGEASVSFPQVIPELETA